MGTLIALIIACALMLTLVLDFNRRFPFYAATPRLGVLFLFVPLLGITAVRPMSTRHTPRSGVSITNLVGPRLGPMSEHFPRLGANIVSTMAPRLGSLIHVQDLLRCQSLLGLIALFWTVLRPSPPHVVLCDFVFLFDCRGAVIDEFVHCPTKTANYLRRCDRTCVLYCCD